MKSLINKGFRAFLGTLIVAAFVFVPFYVHGQYYDYGSYGYGSPYSYDSYGYGSNMYGYNMYDSYGSSSYSPYHYGSSYGTSYNPCSYSYSCYPSYYNYTPSSYYYPHYNQSPYNYTYWPPNYPPYYPPSNPTYPPYPYPTPTPPPAPAPQVICTANVNSAYVGTQVTWTARVYGGIPPYSYSWSGEGVQNVNSPTATAFYTTPGSKAPTVTVRSSGNNSQVTRAGCQSIQVNNYPTYPGYPWYR